MKPHILSPRQAILPVLALTCLLAGAGAGSAAPYVDNFSSAANLTTFGNVTVSVASNTLTASRTAANVDSGFNWTVGGSGTGYFSLQAGDQQFVFQLDAVTAVNGGYYVVNALLFDSGGSYLSEITVQSDTNAIGTFSYNIASLASGSPTATQWFPRVRIHPYGSSNAGFEFENFSAIPEPSSVALFSLAGLLAAVFLRRRSA